MDRKNHIILLITVIITGVTLLSSAMRAAAEASTTQEEKATNGYAGEWDNRTWSPGTNITWTYDTATRTLSFSGTGKMMDNDAHFEMHGEMKSAGTWYIWHKEAEHVVIGEGITNIGSFAFFEFESLIDVLFPNSLQCIGDKVFYDCWSTSFKSITIPGNVKVVGDGAFEQCRFLSEIIIENGVEKIGNYVFYNTNIKEIIFPESVHEYGISVLESCSDLKKVILLSEIKKIPSHFVLDCTGLQEFTISKSVEIIGSGAFEKTSLESIKLPKNLKEIGNSAFEDTSLKNIKLPKTLKKIGDDAFRNTPLKSIKLPKSLEKLGAGAFNGTFLKTIEIPKHVEEMAIYNKWGSRDGVFSNNKKLKMVKIKSKKLKRVEDAFYNFPTKAVITVPKGKKKSYSKMFYNEGLSKKVKIKESNKW